MKKRQLRPNSKANKPKKPLESCSICKNKFSVALNIRQALYRKYSFTQNHYFLKTFEKAAAKKIQPQCEYIQSYQKKLQQRFAFKRVKQIYSVHQQIPRIFHPQIRQILNKCHYRKRLIQYFRMAKTFGLPVQSFKLSTFLLGISNQMTRLKNIDFQPIVDKISMFQFSEYVEKGILQTMNQSKKPNLNPQQIF